MGGIKKGFGAGGRFWRSVNKVVDPLNIMDPMGVLPTSMIAGKKPFQFDRTFGKLQWNLGGGGSTSYSMPRSKMDTSQMFSAQNEMLASMQAQNNANAAKKQASLDQLRSSSPLFPLPPNQQNSTNLSQSSASSSTPVDVTTKEYSTAAVTTNNSPIDIVYKPSTSAVKSVAANSFTLPDMTSIKFGGT